MISTKPQENLASQTSENQSTMETENPSAHDSSLILNLPKYIGLPNQGATCYMNSLLQTLFMTPEFRSALYGWKYDEKRDARPEDCIPFQLQKLFASLQLKHAGGVSTRALTKSFQWQESTSFEQHDIQEFSSVLFDAIDQSLRDAKSDTFIDELFEGTTVSYVKCLECGYESSRPENFLNIGLTVKNEFDKIYNDSLQKALQIYLKPEILEGPNQYFCEVCNKKVDATKGTRFVKAPKLMNIIINRFSFDLIYLRRVKLDDRFSFPFILNMNDYINGYEGIKNKVSEESTPEYFDTFNPPKKTTTKGTTTKKTGTTTTANKQGTKTVGGKPVRSNIRSYISDMKKQTKQDDGVDFVIYSKDDGLANPPPLIENNPIVEQYGAIPSSKEESNTQNATPGSTSGSTSQVASRGDLEEGLPKTRKQPDPFDIEITVENDQLGMSPSKKIKKNSDNLASEQADKTKSGKMDEETSEELKARLEAQRLEEEENYKKIMEERKNTINEYLQDGPLVYELYSILVHSGGAYGGHYYAYIKSFEDGKWYNFNDTSVSGIDQKDIAAKTFGGGKSANAYMLIYRQVNSDQVEKFDLSEKSIPEYLKKFIEEETKKYQEVEMQKVERAKNLSIKVYNKLEVKYFPAHLDETLRSFQKKVFEVYNIQEKPENVRLRLYHAVSDTMQDTFNGKEDKTLNELKITPNKSFIIEIKQDHEQFEEYDADKTFYKVAVWRENLPDLTENTLKPEKIFVNKEGTLKELAEGVANRFNIPVEQVRIVKKSQIGGFTTAEILNPPENMDKKFAELRVFEGPILYAEKAEDPDQPILWKEEFDRDAYNYKIRFNTPIMDHMELNVDYNNFVMIDARKSIRELKTEICKTLNLDENEVLIRKGGKMGAEIKDLRQTILSANFVTGSSIYVEFGKPTVVGEMRVFVSLAVRREEDENLLYDFEELFEQIISGDDTATQVKEMIVAQAKRTKGINWWNPDKMRLRERVGSRLAKVYRDSALRHQGVSDKKQISIELLDEPENLAPKEQLAICRVWNPETLDIGPRFEVIIDRTKSLKHFAEKIHEKNQEIKIENMMGCKVLGAWKFIRYDLLFQEWVSFDDESCSVSAHPLYLNADGVIVFLKDKTLKEKELSEEEKKNIGVARVRHKTDHTPGGGGYSSYNPKEASLKIHVKKKQATGENQADENIEGGVSSLGDVGEAQIGVENNSGNEFRDEEGDDDAFKPFF